METPSPFRILFVCMGNICRSPAAENILRTLVAEAGLQGSVACDSAGTIGYHAGNPADARMRQAAVERGLTLVGRARQIRFEDFQEFDLIVAMDRSNLRDLHELDRHAHYRDKTVLFCSFCSTAAPTEDVPDPYYGGQAGFEAVLDLLEDGCQGILNHLRTRAEV